MCRSSMFNGSFAFWNSIFRWNRKYKGLYWCLFDTRLFHLVLLSVKFVYSLILFVDFSGGIRQYLSVVTNSEAFIGNVCKICRNFPSVMKFWYVSIWFLSEDDLRLQHKLQIFRHECIRLFETLKKVCFL